MTARRSAGVLARVRACAKINLSLHIAGVRADGFHELRTLLQSIALADTLTFFRSSGPFAIECDDPDCPVDERNLVWKAAERVWRVSGRRGAPRGIRVRIAKRIPLQAGLGGGSSDGAAALRTLAAIWRARLDGASRARIASRLGSDVPFFFDGGTSLGVGRGDRLVEMPDVRRLWVVLALPDFGVSTKDAYMWHREVQRLSSRKPDGALCNDLQPVVAARHPQISSLVRSLARAGARHAAMSGSGSAVFGLFEDRSTAEAAAAGLRSCRTLLTRTVSRRRYQSLAAPVFPGRA